VSLTVVNTSGRPIACQVRRGAAPTIVFFPGYASDMEGAKAVALDGLAAAQRRGMLRFDYSGTGSSEGQFEDGALNIWLDDALAAIDALTDGPLIFVGSSMGAWIALHAALRRQERVKGLVGIASAPDFTDWGFNSEQKNVIKSKGRLEEANPSGPEPQIVTRTFFESGQRMLLLGGEIELDCPVRLIHGERDAEVPLEVAFRLLRALHSADVQLQVIKGGGHRLSEPQEIAMILRTVAALTESE